MRTIVKYGQTVQFTSGDVTANGVVHMAVGTKVFVHADRLVPTVLGKGTEHEFHQLHNRLWVDCGPGAEIYRDRDGVVCGMVLPEEATA